MKDNKQLLLYSLAYQNIFGKLPKRISLLFLESGLVSSKSIGEDDLDRIKKDIIDVAYGIRNQDFDPAPSYMSCNFCAYNQICLYADKD